MPPYCLKPSPSSRSALILKVWPETVMSDAIAPVDIPNRMAPAAAVAGTIIAAKRRHLVRPWLSICTDSSSVGRALIGVAGRPVAPGGGLRRLLPAGNE